MADYTVLIRAVLDKANLQAQLNQTTATKPITIKANVELNQAQIDRQVKLWENSLAKMQARAPAAFAKEQVQSQVREVNNLIDGYKRGEVVFKDVGLGMDNVRTSLVQTSAAMKKTTGDGYSFASMTEVAVKKMLMWAIAGTALYGSLRQIQNATQYIKDLDKEMTNIQLVTGQNSQQIRQLASDYNTLATELSVSTLTVAQGALEWQRAGYSASDAMKLLKESTIQATLGNMTAEESTKGLIATLKGFQLGVEDAGSVIDKLVQLDNNYAVSVSSISEALSESSAVAKEAGVTFDQLASYVSVVAATTQQSGDTVGNAFKTILTRFTNVKAGAAIDDMGESLNNVEKVLKTLDISLRDTTDTFRPMGDVIDDISKKWANLSTTQRFQVATAVAGTRQQNIFMALMSNFSEVVKAQGLELESTGLRLERYGIYQESVAASTSRLTAAWEKLVTTTINSGIVKWFIDFGTVLLGVTQKIGILQSAAVIIGAILTTKFAIVIPVITQAIDALAVSMGLAAGAATTLSIALGGAVIGAAVVGLIYLFNALNVSIEKTYEEFEKLKTESSDNQKELRDLAKEYEGLANKQKKSAEDVQRLIEIQGILNNKYGALKDGINIYTDAIDGNSEAIKKNIEWMKEQVSQEAARFLAQNKFKYEDAKKYLAETTKVGTLNAMGGFDQFAGEKTRIELLETYAKKAEETSGAEHDMWVKNYEDLNKEIALRKQLVMEYENYANTIQGGREPTENRKMGSQDDFVELPEKLTKAGKSLEDLQTDLDKIMGSLSSAGTQMDTLVESYQKYGQLGIDQVDQLRKTFGEDYVKALYTENGQIKLNVASLRELMLAKAAEALNTAEAAMIEGGYTKVLKDQYNVVLAYYRQVESGSTFSTKAIEAQKKAQDDLLKITIDMIKQRKDAEKEALQDQLKAFKDSIDARKDALEKQADSEKQHLQDQLDGYKAIIQAEKDLIDQRAREEDFQDKVAEKNKQISDIDAQLLAMQFDNSEEAKAKRLQLEDEKTKVLKELGKVQKENTITNQKEALDKEIDGYEKGIKAKQSIIERNLKSQKDALDQEYKDFETNINAKISAIEDYLKQTGTITNDAMAMLSSKSDAFYQSLLDWNRKFGDSIDANIISKLNEAFNLQLMLNSFGVGSYGGGNTGGGGTGPIGSPGYNYYAPPEYHHEGGIAGGIPKLKETEVFAKLMRGEPIITEKQAYNFMKNTLPNIANMGSGEVKIDMPITIMGNADKSIIPDIKNAVLEVVNGALRDRGTRRNAFSFSGG